MALNLPLTHSLARRARRPYIAPMDRERLLRELNAFLRIPSVSTLPAHDDDCRAAAAWVADELRRLGCSEVEFLGSEKHPVVWGVGPHVPGAPTLLLYGHYDVQPPDPLNEWTTSPSSPTCPTSRLGGPRCTRRCGASATRRSRCAPPRATCIRASTAGRRPTPMRSWLVSWGVSRVRMAASTSRASTRP